MLLICYLDAASLYYPIKICKCPTVFDLMLNAKLVKQLIAKINQKTCMFVHLIKFHKQ